jgi:hypothetical protein
VIIRHAAGASRLATTRAPRSSAVPKAAASRSAVSGVRSTLTSPVTPSAEKRCGEARASKTRFSKTWAPDSTSLNGKIRMPGMTTLSEPIVTSSPIATSSCTRTCERMSQFRPTIAFSIRALRPMCVEASITDATVRARSRNVTLEASTEYGPTVASALIRQ